MNDVVFSVHMPHPGTSFHPIQQFIVVSMNAEIDLQHDESDHVEQIEQRKSRFSSKMLIILPTPVFVFCYTLEHFGES